MKFWFFIFFCSLLLPTKMILSGNAMKKSHGGIDMHKTGWIALGVSAFVILLCIRASILVTGMVGVALMIAQAVLSRVLLFRSTGVHRKDT